MTNTNNQYIMTRRHTCDTTYTGRKRCKGRHCPYQCIPDVVCYRWLGGECKEDCEFLHPEFLRGIRIPNFRIQLCKQYASSSGCSRGDKCTYAHGVDQLRIKSMDIDTCLSWLIDGMCFIPTCTFQHNIKERGVWHPDYKRYMCPYTNCKQKLSGCIHAHHEWELIS